MSFKSLSVLVVASLSAAACAAGPSTDQAADEALQAVTAASDAYADGWRKGDVTAIVANVAENVVVSVAGQPDIKGRAAAQKQWGELLATMKVTKLETRRDPIFMSGDLAIDAGEYDEVVEAPGQPPMDIHGRYLAVWQRQADGSWKTIRFMGMENAPTSAPAPK